MTFTFDDTLVRDLYKDAYGFRPSVAYMLEWESMTNTEKQVEWDLLLSVFASAEARLKEQQEAAITNFNKRITHMIEMGAKSKKQAIRWICDAERIDYNDPDVGYICYQLGLPYSMEKEIA